MADAQTEREIRRLVEEEGVTEEQARRLATERQFDIPLGADGKPIPLENQED